MSIDHSVRGALQALSDAVDVLAALADPAASSRVERADAALVVTGALALAGRLSAIAARSVPVVEADGWWSLEGARSITSWVAVQGRVSHGQATRLVTLGRALRDDLPATAIDAVSGAVSIEAAHVLASVATTPARKEALGAPAADCGEQFLVENAGELTIGQLRVLARRWAAHADPDADERGYREASDREFLDLANTTEGWHLSGFLTAEHGHALTAALDAMMGRSADQAGEPAGRRRARALNNVVRTVLDRDLTGATGDHRPQITVVTDLATLRRALDGPRPAAFELLVPDSPAGSPPGGSPPAGGPPVGSHLAGVPPAGDPPAADLPAGDPHAGEPPASDPPASDPPVVVGPVRRALAVASPRPEQPADGGSAVAAPRPEQADVQRFAVAELVGTGPIPDSVLARLACDSQLTRVVFGARSVVLNAGRAERTYGGAKRRAMIARDGLCQFPGCSAPPAMSEVHHTEHWLRDRGETDVRTGVLVCWHHHHVIHERGIEVRRTVSGSWSFVDRRGRQLVAPIG